MSDESPFIPISPEKILEMSPEELAAYSAMITQATSGASYIPPPEPFFDALANPETSGEQIQTFLNEGADPNQTRQGRYGRIENPLMVAVRAGNVAVASLLIEAGASVAFVGSKNYSIVLDACFMEIEMQETKLIDMLALLLKHGADPDQGSDYGESPVKVTARAGRFDALRLLLDHGASPAPLAWNELMHAVVLGTIDEVEKALDTYPDIEQRDSVDCTALMLALKMGDLEKSKILVQYGASPNSIPDAREEPLHCAIASGKREIVEFFLSLKAEYDPKGYDDRGPMATAVYSGNQEIMEFLIQSYRNDASFQKYLDSALYDDDEGKYSKLLIESGADPGNIRRLARRTILNHRSFGSEELTKISHEQYLEGRSPTFGTSNPTLTNRPFWLAMIRTGYSGYGARQTFEPNVQMDFCGQDPVWCAERFGQSITFLPDGRVIEIGGEHEDGYDPDFCIYNDVFVHLPDGSTDIYCYPITVFPPTDNHSATLVGNWIYIVGTIGYQHNRSGDHIPVYRLNIDSFVIEKVVTQKSPPYQVYSHLAKLVDGNIIHISGGKKLAIGKRKAFSKKGKEEFGPNLESHLLDLNTLTWISGD